jgi:hypothetical protein
MKPASVAAALCLIAVAAHAQLERRLYVSGRYRTMFDLQA